jgi:hypothetical protein
MPYDCTCGPDEINSDLLFSLEGRVIDILKRIEKRRKFTSQPVLDHYKNVSDISSSWANDKYKGLIKLTGLLHDELYEDQNTGEALDFLREPLDKDIIGEYGGGVVVLEEACRLLDKNYIRKRLANYDDISFDDERYRALQEFYSGKRELSGGNPLHTCLGYLIAVGVKIADNYDNIDLNLTFNPVDNSGKTEEDFRELQLRNAKRFLLACDIIFPNINGLQIRMEDSVWNLPFMESDLKEKRGKVEESILGI